MDYINFILKLDLNDVIMAAISSDQGYKGEWNIGQNSSYIRTPFYDMTVPGKELGHY